MTVGAGLIENGLTEAYFENAFEWNPDRWLNPNCLKDAYSFIPFSSGPRNCIGQHLAIIET